MIVTCKSTSFTDVNVEIKAIIQPVNYIGGVGAVMKKYKEVETIERKDEGLIVVVCLSCSTVGRLVYKDKKF